MSTQPQSRVTWSAVRAELRSAAEPAVAERYRRISPTKGTVLGITVPALRAKVKAFAKAHRSLGVADAVQFTHQAFDSKCREEMLFAVFLLAGFKKAFDPALWEHIDPWVDQIDNWEVCDQLATGVAGEMIARAVGPQREAKVRCLVRWAGAPDPWRRRFAAATTTTLNQKGRSDAQPALRVCERLVMDEDRNVRKAVGWALREACKSDARAVLYLLREHQATMPRGLLRESAEKLPAAQRRALGVG